MSDTTQREAERRLWEEWAEEVRVAYRSEKHGLVFYDAGTKTASWVAWQAGRELLARQAAPEAPTSSWFDSGMDTGIVPAAATTASASGLDEAAAYRLWRDCEIAEDAWFIEHLSDYLPRDCANRAPTAAEWDAAMLRVMDDRAALAATEKKEQK